MNEGLRSQASRVTDIVDTQIADPHIPIDRYNIIGMMRQHIDDNLVAYGDAHLGQRQPVPARDEHLDAVQGLRQRLQHDARCAVAFRPDRQFEDGFAQLRRDVESGPDSAAAIRPADTAGVPGERAP